MSSSPLRTLHPDSSQLRGRLPRMADAAVQRARLTVVPRTRRAPRTRVPFVTLVSVLLVGGIVGLLLFNTSMQQASFASTALEQQAATLTAREQALRADLEALRDPQALAEHATRIGMVPPAQPCFLNQVTGQVTGVCAAATADDALPVALPQPVKPAELAAPPAQQPAQPPTRDSATPPARDGGEWAGADNRSRDTQPGSRANGRGEGRQGSQQNQQSQESQQNQNQNRNQQDRRQQDPPRQQTRQ